MTIVSSKFAQLPDELLIWIFSFGDQIRWRQGKWINQILSNDPRKNILKRIPRPIYIPPLLEPETIEDQEIMNYHNDKKNRVYVSLKNGKKEMIHHCFNKENHHYYDQYYYDQYYYEYIYLAKGRMIGYAHKKLYRIDLAIGPNGTKYNQYTIIDDD
jgi:hypothetical protein